MGRLNDRVSARRLRKDDPTQPTTIAQSALDVHHDINKAQKQLNKRRSSLNSTKETLKEIKVYNATKK